MVSADEVGAIPGDDIESVDDELIDEEGAAEADEF